MAKRRSSSSMEEWSEIDSLTLATAASLGEIAALCGCTPPAFSQILLKAADAFSRMQAKTSSERVGGKRTLLCYELMLAHQMLTEWRKNPAYVSEDGSPKDLPKRGRVSLTSLARLVSEHLDVESSLRYLLQMGAVRQHGKLYSMHSRWVRTTGAGAEAYKTLAMLSAEDALRALQRNLRATSPKLAVFQRRGDNMFVPTRVVPRARREIKRRGKKFLEWVDTHLERCAKQVRPGEPTTWFGMQLMEVRRGSPMIDKRPSKRAG